MNFQLWQQKEKVDAMEVRGTILGFDKQHFRGWQMGGEGLLSSIWIIFETRYLGDKQV